MLHGKDSPTNRTKERNDMDQKEISRFFDTHPLEEFSAARFAYSLYFMPEAEEIVEEYVQKFLHPSEGDIRDEGEIHAAETADEWIRLMRKPLSKTNQSMLRKKLLEHEDEVLPLIQKRALTNRQDEFIENTLYFFLHSETDCCDWIMENYNVFKCEYLKSLLCLVIGIRCSDVSLIPVMMAETDRFALDYPDESFDQGPLLAVYELAHRFLGYEYKE